MEPFLMVNAVCQHASIQEGGVVLGNSWQEGLENSYFRTPETMSPTHLCRRVIELKWQSTWILTLRVGVVSTLSKWVDQRDELWSASRVWGSPTDLQARLGSPAWQTPPGERSQHCVWWHEARLSRWQGSSNKSLPLYRRGNWGPTKRQVRHETRLGTKYFISLSLHMGNLLFNLFKAPYTLVIVKPVIFYNVQ